MDEKSRTQDLIAYIQSPQFLRLTEETQWNRATGLVVEILMGRHTMDVTKPGRRKGLTVGFLDGFWTSKEVSALNPEQAAMALAVYSLIDLGKSDKEISATLKWENWREDLRSWGMFASNGDLKAYKKRRYKKGNSTSRMRKMREAALLKRMAEMRQQVDNKS
jgi:hypothetical protein